MWWDRGGLEYPIFPPEERRKLPKEHDYRLFYLWREVYMIKIMSVGASEFFLGFICNCLSYFTTAKISFTSILSIQNKLLFRLFCQFCEYYFVHSGIRIGPKRTQLPPIPCILIPVPKERALNVTVESSSDFWTPPRLHFPKPRTLIRPNCHKQKP